MKFPAILADPPWAFKTYSEKGKGRSADRHYSCMTIDEIEELPVNALADKNSVLFLWTTSPMIPRALEVIDAWGFSYKTVAFTWVKVNRKAPGFFMGNGYWTRANSEYCLLATQGHPHRKHRDVRQLIVAPRREHSRKPDDTYECIERLVDGPYLELFARYKRKGWSSWGNEIKSDIELME